MVIHLMWLSTEIRTLVPLLSPLNKMVTFLNRPAFHLTSFPPSNDPSMVNFLPFYLVNAKDLAL